MSRKITVIGLNAATAVTRARQAAEDAEAARDQAQDISNIAVPDAVITAIDADAGSAFRQQSDARNAATYAPRTALVEDLPEPFFIGHMGALLLYPENTMEGIRAAVATDCDAIEFDVHLLADGSLGVIHDGTLTAKTTSTGNVADQTAGSWHQLVLDAGSWLGGGWGNLRPPLFTEILDEFGGKKVLAVELKSVGSGVPALAEIQKRGLDKSVFALSGFWAELIPFAAAGIRCYYVTDTPDHAALLAAGYDVAISIAASDATFTAAVAAGLKVMAYRTTRRKDRDRTIALGATAHITDDPIYTQGDLDRATDPYAAQTWFPGMLPANSTVRGSFTAPDEWGFTEVVSAGARAVLQGWMCPEDTSVYNPATNTIQYDFDLVFAAAADTGRWGGCYFGFANDQEVNDGLPTRTDADGYRCLITPLGVLQVSLYDNGATGTALGSLNGADLTLPQTVPMRLTVTPTQITWRRMDNAEQVSVTDSSRRGPYFHFASSGATVRYKNVVRTIS